MAKKLDAEQAEYLTRMSCAMGEVLDKYYEDIKESGVTQSEIKKFDKILDELFELNKYYVKTQRKLNNGKLVVTE